MPCNLYFLRNLFNIYIWDRIHWDRIYRSPEYTQSQSITKSTHKTRVLTKPEYNNIIINNAINMLLSYMELCY